MEFCIEAGIPHSQFLEWPLDDQAKVLAHYLDKRIKCNKCGTDPNEWMDEEGLPIEPPPYEATTVACLGCATLRDANEEIPQERKPFVTAHLRRIENKAGWKWQLDR